jgi:hypothetical protein
MLLMVFLNMSDQQFSEIFEKIDGGIIGFHRHDTGYFNGARR